MSLVILITRLLCNDIPSLKAASNFSNWPRSFDFNNIMYKLYNLIINYQIVKVNTDKENEFKI